MTEELEELGDTPGTWRRRRRRRRRKVKGGGDPWHLLRHRQVVHGVPVLQRPPARFPRQGIRVKILGKVVSMLQPLLVALCSGQVVQRQGAGTAGRGEVTGHRAG